jgi:putative toxin-antitoxin system antitoxin component (TIGR02293 family)
MKTTRKQKAPKASPVASCPASHGPSTNPSPSAATLHYGIIEGYGIGAVNEAADKFGISVGAMAGKIGIPRSTLHRKLAAKGRLTVQESDALARFTALLTHATEVFAGHQESARTWLTAPQIGLGGAIPLDFAQTTFGYQEVHDLLGRIDYGVYS